MELPPEIPNKTENKCLKQSKKKKKKKRTRPKTLFNNTLKTHKISLNIERVRKLDCSQYLFFERWSEDERGAMCKLLGITGETKVRMIDVLKEFLMKIWQKGKSDTPRNDVTANDYLYIMIEYSSDKE